MKRKISRHVGTGKLRLFVEQSPAETAPAKQDLAISLRDMIALLSAGAGVLTALIYLSGRYYAGGYFGAMNIPSYQVSFSLWEYGEVVWLPVSLYIFTMMIVSGVLWGIGYAIWDGLVTPVARKLTGWVQDVAWGQQPGRRLPGIGPRAEMAFSIAGLGLGLLCFAVIVFLSLQLMLEFGKSLGTRAVLQTSPRAELVSAVPLPMEKVRIITNSIAGVGEVNSFYAYSDLHLLTYNNGKYYLFRDIDPTTCRPEQVFVINADQDIQINLSAAEPLDEACETR